MMMIVYKHFMHRFINSNFLVFFSLTAAHIIAKVLVFG